MPDTRIIRNTPALAAQVDARSIADTTLFARVDGLGEVLKADLAIDASIYWSLPAFLHGFGSTPSACLESIIDANWGGAGSITIGIGLDDLFFIRSSDVSFTIEANGSNSMFGFSDGGEVSVIDGASYIVRASQPWQRGVFEMAHKLELKDNDTDVVHSVVSDFPRVQSLPTWIRARGSVADSDDVWAGLTVEDADPQDLAHWLVEPDGRVSVSYFEDGGFLLGTNTEFWHMVGGIGTEEAVDAFGGRKTLTTTNRAPSFLALDHPYISMRRSVQGRDQHQLMADGSVVSSGLPVVRGWQLSVRVSGPAYGPTQDQERHLRQWWSTARRNITLYPQWGDMDATHGSIDVRRHADALTAQSHERYSDGFTVEADDTVSHWGKRKGGRLMLRRAPEDNQGRVETYEHDLDVFQDIEISFLDRVQP